VVCPGFYYRTDRPIPDGALRAKAYRARLKNRATRRSTTQDGSGDEANRRTGTVIEETAMTAAAADRLAEHDAVTR
jgi:hypothetical protein